MILLPDELYKGCGMVNNANPDQTTSTPFIQANILNIKGKHGCLKFLLDEIKTTKT